MVANLFATLELTINCICTKNCKPVGITHEYNIVIFKSTRTSDAGVKVQRRVHTACFHEKPGYNLTLWVLPTFSVDLLSLSSDLACCEMSASDIFLRIGRFDMIMYVSNKMKRRNFKLQITFYTKAFTNNSKRDSASEVYSNIYLFQCERTMSSD